MKNVFFFFAVACISVTLAQQTASEVSGVVIEYNRVGALGIIPARFPTPSKDIGIVYSCIGTQAIVNVANTEASVTDVEAENWYKKNFTLRNNTLFFDKKSVGCDGEKSWLTAPTYQSLLFSLYSTDNSVVLLEPGTGNDGNYDDTLSICSSNPAISGCAKIRIQEGSQGKIYADFKYSFAKNEVIAVSQDKILKPLVFDGDTKEVAYTKAKPVTFWFRPAKSKIWSVVTIDFQTASLTWSESEKDPV